jgi:hypothetical protein
MSSSIPQDVKTPSKGLGDAASIDVLLVTLPFGILHSPSLALGILQARLNAAGISAKCRHFTLDYAARVGLQLYNKIASGFPRNTDLLGEWIFSHAVLRKTTAQQLRYLTRTFGAHGLAFKTESDRIVCTGSDEHKVRLVQSILRLAVTIEEFVEYSAQEILRHSPRVVGFTTVFQQNSATIAVATRLRQLDPSVKIVLGGANCEGPMGKELSRTFPSMDVIVSGEADLAIVPLVQVLLAGCSCRQNLCPISTAMSRRPSMITFRICAGFGMKAILRFTYRWKHPEAVGGECVTTAPSVA